MSKHLKYLVYIYIFASKNMVKCRVDSFSTGTAEWVRDVLTYRSRFSPSTSSTTHMLTTTSGPRAVQGTSDVTYRSRFSPITNADRKQALKQKPSSVSFNHLNGHNEAMKVVRIAAGSSINMRAYSCECSQIGPKILKEVLLTLA